MEWQQLQHLHEASTAGGSCEATAQEEKKEEKVEEPAEESGDDMEFGE